MKDTKKPDIWMPLYVADYQADTAYLTTEQHGAYLLMLMAYWRNGPIPDNDGIIASITRLSPNAWSNTRGVLEGFFQVRDGYWFHKRVEAEYDKAKRNRASAHDKAVKAAQARWAKSSSSDDRMLGALHEHLLGQCPSPSPTQSTSQSKADNPPNPPMGGTTLASKRKARTKQPESTLTEWLDSLGDQDAIAADDPIVTELTNAGVPMEFIGLYWTRFKQDQIDKGRRQKDWRAAFRNAVRGNWYKLWWFDGEGNCRLTTAGEQLRRTHE